MLLTIYLISRLWVASHLHLNNKMIVPPFYGNSDLNLGAIYNYYHSLVGGTYG